MQLPLCPIPGSIHTAHCLVNPSFYAARLQADETARELQQRCARLTAEVESLKATARSAQGKAAQGTVALREAQEALAEARKAQKEAGVWRTAVFGTLCMCAAATKLEQLHQQHGSLRVTRLVCPYFHLPVLPSDWLPPSMHFSHHCTTV